MLIGLTGKKRAGKDSVANHLVANHGFTRVAFADPLKAAALDIDPIISQTGGSFAPGATDRPKAFRLSQYVSTLGWEAAKEEPEVRRFLQHLGVAVRDHVDTDAWVNAGLASTEKLLAEGKSVVITDVRFPNELDAIHRLGGFHFHVDRPGLEATDTHVSETALEPYYRDANAWIINDESLEVLAVRAGNALRQFIR